MSDEVSFVEAYVRLLCGLKNCNYHNFPPQDETVHTPQVDWDRVVDHISYPMVTIFFIVSNQKLFNPSGLFILILTDY